MSGRNAVVSGHILGSPATKGRIVTTIWATDQLADRPSLDTDSHGTDAFAAAVRAEAQHSGPALDDERVQQLAFDLMRERLTELFGPGGSFRVTLGRATQDDALFVSTVADTIAWDVAAALGIELTADEERANPRRAAQQMDTDEHEDIWRHVEDELLKRRKAA